MNPQEDLGNMVKAHIKLEENTTKKIKELEEATANLAARLFLAEMRFDTEKHAKILKTMQDLMKQKEPEAARDTLWETRIHS